LSFLFVLLSVLFVLLSFLFVIPEGNLLLSFCRLVPL
jgi:hypothetical protein